MATTLAGGGSGKTGAVHLGSSKRNLDIFNETLGQAANAIGQSVLNPASGIISQAFEVSANGNQVDNMARLPSSTMSSLFAISSIYGKSSLQDRVGDNFTNAISTNSLNISNLNGVGSTSAMQALNKTHNLYQNKMNEINSNFFSSGTNAINTLNNQKDLNFIGSNNIGNKSVDSLSGKKDFFNMRSEVSQMAKQRGLGDVFDTRQAQGIINKTNSDIANIRTKINTIKNGRPLSALNKADIKTLSNLNKQIKTLQENVNIAAAGQALMSVRGANKAGSSLSDKGKFAMVGLLARPIIEQASNTHEYRGYQTLKSYHNFGKLYAKFSYHQAKFVGKYIGMPSLKVAGRVLAPAAKIVGRGTMSSIRFAAFKIGGVRGLNAANRLASRLSNLAQATTRYSRLSARLLGGVVSMPFNGTAKPIIKKAGKKVFNFTKGRIVNFGSRVGARISARLSRHVVGRGVLAGTRFLRGTGRFGFGLLRGVGGIVSAPFKLVFKAFDIINTIKKIVLKKLLLLLGKVVLVQSACIVILLGAAALFSSMGVIGDAIMKKYEDFISKTTMGATYEKLSQKETEFMSYVSNLANSKIPDDPEYKEHYITNYTNFDVIFLGPDGQPITSDFASTINESGDTIINNVVFNSTSDAIWTFCKKLGWNEYGIAGLMGNIYNECSMNHKAHHPGQDIGIVQWTDNKTTRRYSNFLSWSKQRGLDILDINTQLKFLMLESANYKKVVNKMAYNNWTNIQEPTNLFINDYERYGNYLTDTKERGERWSAADTYYKYYHNNENFKDIEVDQNLKAEMQVNENATDSTNEVDGINMPYQYTANTIKAILTMGYIYIDRDFKKYGSLLDKAGNVNFSLDSVYKDYCAKLYDSSHLIAKSTEKPKIYYHPSLKYIEGDKNEYHAALDSCNNAIPAGEQESTDSSLGREKTVSYKTKKISYSYEKDNGEQETVTKPVYEIYATGAYGQIEFSYDKHDSYDSREKFKSIENEMRKRGSTNYKFYQLNEDENTSYWTCVSLEAVCRGHIDGKAYVFISNVYDPSQDEALKNEAEKNKNNEAQKDEERENNEENTAENTTPPISKNNLFETLLGIKTVYAKPKLKDDEENEDEYLDAEETIKKEGWEQVGQKWFYYKNGKMVKDTRIALKLNDVTNYYYFKQNGEMYTGLVDFKDKGRTYKRYFGEDGALKLGWQVIDGKDYYFSEKVDKHRFGEMYLNEKTPDGYMIGNDGIWINNNLNNNQNSNGNNSSNNETGNNTNSNNKENKPNEKKSDYNEKAYDFIMNKGEETKFSLYAIDKYATSFNSEAQKKVEKANEMTTSLSGEIIDDKQKIPDEEIKVGRVAEPDDNSTNEADAKTNGGKDMRAAEKYIMQQICKTDEIEVLDWWKNEKWYTNFVRHDTYFRIYNGEKSFDELKPDPSLKDKNVVNVNNSVPFVYSSYTPFEKRNKKFEEEGWDESNILQVRLILADNWEERYGIKVRNRLNMTSFSNADISALINNSDYKKAMEDAKGTYREILLTNIFKFGQQAARFGTKYGQIPGHTYIKNLSEMKAGQLYDCSSFVTSMGACAGQNTPLLSTDGILKDTKHFDRISFSEIKPGDIFVYRYPSSEGEAGHTFIYLGGNDVAEASGKDTPLAQSIPHVGTFQGKLNKFNSSPKKAILRYKGIDEKTLDASYQEIPFY